MGVPAVLVEDVDAADAPPGAFEYFRDGGSMTAGMVYRCPCGCRATGALNFRPHPSPSWDWDGDVEKPTLSPSVHHILRLIAGGQQTHWHGWLRAGVWEAC